MSLKRPNNRNFSYQESVSLKEYFEAKIGAMDDALRLARETMEHRLEGMNEFREQLKSQAATFISRADFELSCHRMQDEIKSLTKSRDIQVGKASMATWIAVVAVVISVVNLAMRLAK